MPRHRWVPGMIDKESKDDSSAYNAFNALSWVRSKPANAS